MLVNLSLLGNAADDGDHGGSDCGDSWVERARPPRGFRVAELAPVGV